MVTTRSSALDRVRTGLTFDDVLLVPRRSNIRSRQDVSLRTRLTQHHEIDIPVLAANAPRRYVNRVSRLGPESLEALSGAAESWLPPLPYPPASPEYRQETGRQTSDG